jgi:hypothetical protein
MATKYTKWPNNRPNGHKINQHLPLQDPPKFTQIGIFGMKICHLATLVMASKSVSGLTDYKEYQFCVTILFLRTMAREALYCNKNNFCGRRIWRKVDWKENANERNDNLEPILRLHNLQLQRLRCSRL